jgi:hypothetical protein
MRKIIYLILLVIALGVSLQIKSWVDSTVIKNTDTATTTPDITATTTLNGSFTCLPHAGNPEVTTMECAFGFKTSDNVHYALDWSNLPNSAFDLPMDRMYSVTGVVIPSSKITDEQILKYDIAGKIIVSSYEEITKDIPINSAGQLLSLELKKPVIVDNYRITVGAVLEDSRCPADATCVQQGKVRVAVNAENQTENIAEVLEIGQAMPLDTQTLTLVSVDPYPLASKKTLDSEYRFGIIIK